MATQTQVDQQLLDAAMACGNATVRALEAATTAAFAEPGGRDLDAATAYAVWGNQAANTARELLAALNALRGSTPPV